MQLLSLAELGFVIANEKADDDVGIKRLLCPLPAARCAMATSMSARLTVLLPAGGTSPAARSPRTPTAKREGVAVGAHPTRRNPAEAK